MPRALVFDVNETLLDLAALRDPFSRAFGDAAPLGEWFARLLHGSLVATLTDAYEDFASIGRSALDAVAFRRGRKLPAAEREAILETMLELPAHPEVPDALSRLRSAGFPLATLTNSSPEMARAKLEHAGILDRFDRVFSVQEVRRYKPAPEPYLMAAERLGWIRRRCGWWPPTTGTYWERRTEAPSSCQDVRIDRGPGPIWPGPPAVIQAIRSTAISATGSSTSQP